MISGGIKPLDKARQPGRKDLAMTWTANISAVFLAMVICAPSWAQPASQQMQEFAICSDMANLAAHFDRIDEVDPQAAENLVGDINSVFEWNLSLQTVFYMYQELFLIAPTEGPDALGEDRNSRAYVEIFIQCMNNFES